MSVGLAINAVWAVTLWSLSAAGVVLVLRRVRSAIRRDICRFGLLGVPIVLAAVAGAHVWRPTAGLIAWRVEAAAPSETVAPATRETVAAPARRVSAGGAVVAEIQPTPAPAPELLAEPVAEPGASAMPALSAATVSAEPAQPAAVTEAPADPTWVNLAILAAISATVILLAALVHRVGVLALWRCKWRPASGAWVSLTQRLAGRMGLARRFSVYIVPGLSQPAAAGVFRPAILLPDSPDARITPALRGALLHELGHVAGADPMWRLIGLGAAALAWWCPAVWLLHRRAQVEGEMTADDCALEGGARPTDLAKALLEFAERIQEPVPAAVPGMGCYLKRRVEMMIDTNKPHNSKVAGRVRWLFGCMALALVIALAFTPLVGVAAAADAEPAVSPAAEGPAAAEPVAPSVDVAIVRNRTQQAAARKERDEVRQKLYSLRYKFTKSEALTDLRKASSDASEAYEKAKATDPEYRAAREAEHALDDALDALVLAKVKSSPEGAALIQKIADLEEERASLSMVYAIAEVKLTHEDSRVARALAKDKELARLYGVYRASATGPVRDKNRAAYHAARKAAMARLPQAVALTEEMASAKNGIATAYNARKKAEDQLDKLEDRIKGDKSDAEIVAAYKNRSDARKKRYETYESGAIKVARDARSKAYSEYSAKLKELMAADPEAGALQTRYKEIDKEIDRLEDEAKALKKKQKSAPKKADVGEA